MHLSFHGAAGGVTGSKHLLDTGRQKLLVDCGMFQGLKELRRRNWEPAAVRPRVPGRDPAHPRAHRPHRLDAAPDAVRVPGADPLHGGHGGTAELMLLDAAHLQEEDAAWANKKGFSSHAEPEPLYTTIDALRALKLLRPHPYGRWLDLGAGRLRVSTTPGTSWARLSSR